MTKETEVQQEISAGRGGGRGVHGDVLLTESDAAALVPVALQEFGIDPADLRYRGEGNYTLVTAYERTRQVLRFRKVARPQRQVEMASPSQLGHYGQNGSNCVEPVTCSCPFLGVHCCPCYQSRLASIRKLRTRALRFRPKMLNLTYMYIETVMKKLLGEQFIPPIDVVHVDTESLRRISSQVEPLRPNLAKVLAKEIDVNCHEVIVSSDVAFLPPAMDKYAVPGCSTLCIEIKPKQGFISQPELARRNCCRFCLIQFHPKKQKQFAKRSNYCPCDLFSGDKSRMIKAIRALIDTPQINLRLFQNGQLLYHAGSQSKDTLNSCLRGFFDADLEAAADAFVETIYAALVHEFESAPTAAVDDATVALATEFKYPEDSHYTQTCASQRLLSNNHEQGAETAVVDFQPTRLSPDCVLGRILSVQLLDKLSIEDTLSHYGRVAAFLQANHCEWDFSLGKLTDFLGSLNAPESVLQSARHNEDYLTSLVANNFSVMLTMAPSCLPASDLPASVPHVADPISDRGVLFSFAIVDLDPKPLNNLKLHTEELEALRAFNAAVAAGKT